MNVKNIALIAAVVAAAGGVVLLKQSKNGEKQQPVSTQAEMKDALPQGKAMPRLVDLGAGKCIPCKMMKPVLEELKANYAETFKTEFIDVWENAEAAKPYNINLIPTQIFYGADGKELFRHEGFFSKEDILNKWKELGVEKTK